MEPSAAPPSLKAVERALRETTERLALECAAPSLQPPPWGELHWCLAQAVAALQGVSALLGKKLRWPAPRAWSAFLDDQAEHTLNRYHGLASLAARLDAGARERGIGMLGLKGMALHALGLYQPGERPMADLDLLVEQPRLAPAEALLADFGFVPSGHTRRERTYEARAAQRPARLGEHSGNVLKVELHTRIAEQLPIRESDITLTLLPRPLAPGLHGYPSLAALMTHLLLHAAGNVRARSLRFIQLHDIAVLAGRLSPDDWRRVLGSPGAARWWAFPPLALVSRYFPGVIPAAALARAQAVCPPLLRRLCQRQSLADVSLSYMWIQFCPGIEWCASIGEALRYVYQRIAPSAQMRADILQCERTQLWARDTPWSRLSRPQRIARRLLTRCPRDATMLPVQAALEHLAVLQPRAAQP